MASALTHLLESNNRRKRNRDLISVPSASTTTTPAAAAASSANAAAADAPIPEESNNDELLAKALQEEEENDLQVRIRFKTAREEQYNARLWQPANAFAAASSSFSSMGGGGGGGRGYIDIDQMNYDQLNDLIEENGDVVPKNPPASASVIQSLPCHTFVQRDGQVTPSCCICMNDFENEDMIKILPCMHSFHAMEIDRWLQSNAKCPQCQHVVSS